MTQAMNQRWWYSCVHSFTCHAWLCGEYVSLRSFGSCCLPSSSWRWCPNDNDQYCCSRDMMAMMMLRSATISKLPSVTEDQCPGPRQLGSWAPDWHIELDLPRSASKGASKVQTRHQCKIHFLKKTNSNPKQDIKQVIEDFGMFLLRRLGSYFRFLNRGGLGT